MTTTLFDKTNFADIMRACFVLLLRRYQEDMGESISPFMMIHTDVQRLREWSVETYERMIPDYKLHEVGLYTLSCVRKEMPVDEILAMELDCLPKAEEA